MDGKTAGFLFARGLAIILFVLGLTTLVTTIVYMSSDPGFRHAESLVPWLATSSIYLGIAVALWMGADRFCPSDEASTLSPVTTRSAIGVGIVAIAGFFIVQHLAGCLSFFWLLIQPMAAAGGGIDWKAPYLSDTVTVILCGLLIPIGYKQVLIVRSAHQPDLNDSERE